MALRDFCHVQIIEANYQNILPIWQSELWPGRKDIEDHSWMKLGGGHYSLFNSPQINFWIATEQYKDVGVISAHTLPEAKIIRFRGLWVHKDFRRKSIASALLQVAEQWASFQGAELLWTYPRQAAWPVYEKHGFTMQTSWVEDEKGLKHCYAIKRL